MENRAKLVSVCAASLAVSLCTLAPRAFATGPDIYTLPIGGNIIASPTIYNGSGTTLDTVVSPFTSSTIDGTITSSVIQGDTSNPYGGLTFVYSVLLNNFSSDSLSTMTVGSYGGFVVDVSYDLTGSEVAPGNFTRSPASNDGSTLRFLWSNGGGLQPNNTGALVVVQTGAQAYTTADGSVIDSQSVNISTLAPVPEPGIASLLVAGFGVFAFWRRNSK